MVKVCVVGNGPSEVDSGNGETIDNHDKIYRFNNFKLDGYEKDYGSKTTHWVTTFCSDIRHTPDRIGHNMVCPLPLDEAKYLKRYSSTNQFQFHLHQEKTEFIPVDIFEELLELNKNPSTGLALLWWLNKLGVVTDRVQVFGFSFFKDGDHHYFGKGVSHHNGDLESQIVDKILK